MYQLIVIVMQFCFAYPKSKPSIDDNQQSDQMTTPGAIKSGRRGDKDEDEVKLDGLTVDNNGDGGKSEGGNFKGGNETKLSSNDTQGAIFTQPPTTASSLTSVGLPGCPLPITEVVKKHVNITVSYNPTKSLYNSFDQLRSSRPNCFISSIIRGDGQPSTLPGFAVKTTAIKSPEEVTGVKSPSPEAWRVAIDTGGGINWTQTKPPATPTGNNLIANQTSDEKLFIMGKNVNQSTNHCQSIDNQQSTFLETNKHLDGLESIQIITKETIL